MKKEIKEDRMKQDFKIRDFLDNDLSFKDKYFSSPEVLYPISYSDDLDLRVRLHKSLDFEKDPNLIEVLVPTSSESYTYAIPFCDEINSLGAYYNTSGVYVFYGYSSDFKPKVLYVGESNDLWGRIVKHISGESNLKTVLLNGEEYEPFRYIRWVEIYTLDSDNANQRKLLEQIMIAVKKPLHNNYTEKRTISAERDYHDYLSKEVSIVNEVPVKWSERTWDLYSLDWPYYIEKYNIKREDKTNREIPEFLTFFNSNKVIYKDSKWGLEILN